MRTMKGPKPTAVLLSLLLLMVSTSWSQAIPSDPNNAALLYYQALLVHHEPDVAISDVYEAFVKGEAGPTDEIRGYVRGSRAALDYALLGTRVESCDWGLPYSKGFSLLLSHMSPLRSLCRLVIADARLLASQGDYQAALDRCLAVQRIAEHIGDDTLISYLVAMGIRNLEYGCVKDVMGLACNDGEMLRRIRDEVAKPPKREISAIRPLRIEMEIVMNLMRTDHVEELVRAVAGGLGKKELAEKIAAVDETTLGKNRHLYSDRVQAMLNVLGSSLPYDRVYSELKQLGEGLDANDRASALASAFVPSLAGVYSTKTRTEAYANAIRAGVEICLQRAESGKLPTTLPAGLPKDPFSGQDFRYERTDDGFVLRCQGEDLDKDVMEGFQFVVK